MSWSEETWKKALPIYNAILELPFLKELEKGNLSRGRFTEYLRQDSLYLHRHAGQMSQIAELMTEKDVQDTFRRFAAEDIAGEQSMQEYLIQVFGVGPAEKGSFVTDYYNGHTQKAINSGKPELALAAILPCQWIYNEVGKMILKYSDLKHNPYKKWILEYGDESFTLNTERLLSIIDSYAEKADEKTRALMQKEFLEAAICEYAFWDYGYNLNRKNYEYVYLSPEAWIETIPTRQMKKYPIALTIAGSDSGGGAGIQADIKSISATGSYAASAITAITVQNTVGVTGVHAVPIETIKGQIAAVLSDIGADAVKIGMLATEEVVRAVKASLDEFGITNIVLDPVMVATSGDRLIEESAIQVLATELAPYARVLTPNVPEAEILSGIKIESQDSLPLVGKKLSENMEKISGRKVSVLMKAGHLEDDELIDYFYNAEEDHVIELRSKRVYSKNTHGTGCTLSSAFASYLAQGYSLDDAARNAKDYIAKAIEAGAEYEIGHGHGPVDHFWRIH